MQITFVTRKFRHVQRNLHCDVVHITTKWVVCLTLDCNGVFAIKAYSATPDEQISMFTGNGSNSNAIIGHARIVDIFRGHDHRRNAFIALSMARVRMYLLYSSLSTSLYTRTRSMYPRHISPRSSSCFARSDVNVTSHRSSSLLVPLMTLRGTYCTVRT